MVRRDDSPELPQPTRWWIGVVYLVLFALSVPWYLPATGASPVPLWLGLPYWVVVTLVGNVAVALFTALVAVRYWPDDPTVPPDGEGR